MATEKTMHVIIHTHHADGSEIFAQFRHPGNDKLVHDDLDVAKEGAALLLKKHKGHKFAAYTLVKR